MRMRLGILHDAAAQERMHAREAAEAAAKKKAAEMPTVRTEAQQKAADAEVEKAKTAGEKEEKEAKKPVQPRIRPLSESKAIDLGANFIAESFIFAVAAGLLVWDSWRSRRKENTRREDVADRLEALEEKVVTVNKLEEEIQRLREKYEPENAAAGKKAIEKAKAEAKKEKEEKKKLEEQDKSASKALKQA